jgi:hypothetical protein
MVIVVGVMPGAEAVSAVLELPEPDPAVELELPPEEQAATENVAAVRTTTACQRTR